MLASYPDSRSERDRWILAQRGPRNALDPMTPYAFFTEDECSTRGEVITVSTIFLTNRECPWRCLMCDLWQNTLTETVPIGAIPAQIDYALLRLPPASQIKLYNSGSFFDPHAIPVQDYAAIASRLANFDRVIVECHPALVTENCLRFKDQVEAKLEIAMGLETVHSETLDKLNKRMTVEQFADSAQILKENDIDLRVFLLVKPPFLREDEVFEWTSRSLEFAFDCGATAVTLIPTRGGNGAMETLASIDKFSPPRLAMLEACFAYGLRLGRGRVFADLWNTKQAGECASCYGLRISRLKEMNQEQNVLEPIICEICTA
ncbi:MAG TPA: hypothetical protein VNU92_04325, partial [Edaphobacter sp.]|jgi:radical SAM enzyme (TIGR01210 family)|nr:hypothetical protein [Edaphobacter sp.]